MMGNLNKSSFNTLSCLSGNNRFMGARFKFVRYYSTGLSKESPEFITDFVNKYDSDCFYVIVVHSKKHKLGESVNLSFSVNLPIHDSQLIKIFTEHLDCGVIVNRKNYLNFIVKDFASICEKVIPFFSKYNLQGKQLQVFNIWKQAADLMSRKAHTTPEGLNEIKLLKLLMNNRVSSGETRLVLYGSNLSSTVGSPRFTYNERALVKIPLNKRSIIVGILLSDATLQRLNEGGGARLQFKQKYGQFEYLYFVFFQLSHYCSRGPSVTKAILHKKVHYGLSFTTRSLDCITELYNWFYQDGKKIIPNNLYDLLTWEGLVHWIYLKSNIRSTYLSYRSNKAKGLFINVDGYTIRDIVLLMNVLMIRHRLSCSLHKVKNVSHIYIKNKSIPLLLNGIRPFITWRPSATLSMHHHYGVVSKRGVHNSSPSTVVPVVSYPNADVFKKEIVDQNKDKAGVYRWVHLVSGKSYVGSSVNLGVRLKRYYSYKYLTDIKQNMVINKALLKYGYSSFKLDILEYCNRDDAIYREQYYMDLLKPEYNVLKKAGSSLGFRHSPATIAKFIEARQNIVVSDETRAKLSENNLNRSKEYKEENKARLLKLNLAKGHPVEVLNITTKEKTIYPTVRQAASALNVSHVTVLRTLKSQKLLKGLFEISYQTNHE